MNKEMGKKKDYENIVSETLKEMIPKLRERYFKELAEALIKRCNKNLVNGRGSQVNKWDIEKEVNKLLSKE